MIMGQAGGRCPPAPSAKGISSLWDPISAVLCTAEGIVGPNRKPSEVESNWLTTSEGFVYIQNVGDPFHVLNGSGEEGLLVHVADSKHASKAQDMEFFGFCEGAFIVCLRQA